MPPGQVANSLLERDLTMLLKYAERHLLPTRRMQLQLAKVAQFVHADSTKPLSYYLVAGAPANDDNADGAEEVGSMFAAVSGGNVIKLKGRKKRAS